MNIWELRCANVNDFSMVVPSPETRAEGLFKRIDGRPLDWMYPPVIEYSDARSRGKSKRPVADVAAMLPGVLILSQRGYDVLGTFLLQFGQLLQVQTAGGAEFRYFYNVTNLVACIDVGRSEKTPSGAIWNEEFYDINVPRSAAVFKDSHTAMRRIYTNDSGRAIVEQLVSDANLSGIECGEIQRRPMPGSRV